MKSKILILCLLIALAIPTVSFAETVLCVTDESGLYVSGKQKGEEDEDLRRGATLVAPTSSAVTNSALLRVLRGIGNDTVLISIAVFVIVASIIGFIVIGGYKFEKIR